jgi:hypothetical protein
LRGFRALVARRRKEGQGVSSHEAARLSIYAARALLRGPNELSASINTTPLAVLSHRLARAPALFAPIERAIAIVETDIGQVYIPLVTQYAQG